MLFTLVCSGGAETFWHTKLCWHSLVYQKNYFTFYFTYSVTFTTNFAVTRKSSIKNAFLKMRFEVCIFTKPETPTQVFSCEFCKFFNTNFFIEHLWWLLQSLISREVVSSKLFKGIDPGILSLWCDCWLDSVEEIFFFLDTRSNSEQDVLLLTQFFVMPR